MVLHCTMNAWAQAHLSGAPRAGARLASDVAAEVLVRLNEDYGAAMVHARGHALGWQ
jgi:hypothetical protein